MEGRLVVRSNLAELIELKAAQDGKRLTQHRLQKETGVSLNTIKRWILEAPDSFDNHVVSAFCEYFGCQVGDLLKVVDADETIDVGKSVDTNEDAEN